MNILQALFKSCHRHLSLSLSFSLSTSCLSFKLYHLVFIVTSSNLKFSVPIILPAQGGAERRAYAHAQQHVLPRG